MSADERPLDSGSIQRADDTLWNVDLSVSRALSFVDESQRADFEAVYRWFMKKSGTLGSRHYGKGQRLPGVSPDFAHAAQRGIHKPAGSPYALSVTITKSDLYGNDGAEINLPAGGWGLVYAAHRNNRGGETDFQWNDSLLNCMRDGLPVGVFIAQGDKYRRFLAFVEEYRPNDGTFVLHGPVTSETEKRLFRSEVRNYLIGEEIVELEDTPSEELMRDERVAKLVLTKMRKGQSVFRQELLDAYGGACAVTGFKTGCTLQAAHILNYRGKRSNVARNGLLLRADIHALFDSSQLAIDPGTGYIVVGDSVPDDAYHELNGKPLRLPADKALWPSDEYLGVKFNEFEKYQKAVAS